MGDPVGTNRKTAAENLDTWSIAAVTTTVRDYAGTLLPIDPSLPGCHRPKP